MSYRINEIFYSLQGEGHRAGTANVFVRFSGCNLTCRKDGEEGFDCDTEFASGESYEAEDVLAQATYKLPENQTSGSVIFTGGEPALQLDDKLVDLFKDAGWYVAIETNGTRHVPRGVDWVSCSPKSAEHTLRVGDDRDGVDEVRYVRHEEQGIPKPSLKSTHRFLSPAYDTGYDQRAANLGRCVELVMLNPSWRLSTQQHKAWFLR